MIKREKSSNQNDSFSSQVAKKKINIFFFSKNQIKMKKKSTNKMDIK